MHFSTKKMGVKFFHRKKTKLEGGGGPRGVWQKTTLFPDFFSATFPYNYNNCDSQVPKTTHDYSNVYRKVSLQVIYPNLFGSKQCIVWTLQWIVQMFTSVVSDQQNQGIPFTDAQGCPCDGLSIQNSQSPQCGCW